MAQYRALEGTEIPFRKFGYATLVSFLASIPDIVTLKKLRFSDEVLCKVVPSKNIKDLHKQVEGQKKSKSVCRLHHLDRVRCVSK